MADYILNEWIWADATGENGSAQQAEAFRLLKVLSEGGDRIIVVKGSSFFHKGWKLCVATARPALEIAKFFKMQFLFNSDRCLLLDESELPELPDALKQVKPDDQYLVRAHLKVGRAIVVTTDLPLKEILEEANIPCEIRSDFLRRYSI